MTALHKLVRRSAGLSREAAARAIAAGRVAVDGVVVTRFAEPVLEGARVTLDGRLLSLPRTETWLLHKPRGVLCVRGPDPEGRPTLDACWPEGAPAGLFPVGRLDRGSEGALLLTTDGLLGRRVLHPEEGGLEKVYHVKVRGHVREGDPGLAAWRRGLVLEDGPVAPQAAPILAWRARATWIEVRLREGRNRLVRRMCARVGWQVVKLRRVSIGPVALGDLKPWCARRLADEEVAALRAAVGLPPLQAGPAG